MSQQISGYVPRQDGKGIYGRTLGIVNLHGIYNKENCVTVLKQLETIPFSDKEASFNIGDYGAAGGAASMEFIKNLIISLRELHGPQIEFQVIYEDQPINDFNSLFCNLSGSLPGVSSYLGELEGVFPFASGTEFRKQCAPSDSMHFILSTNCIQWLSKLPIKYKDSLLYSKYTPLQDLKTLFAQGQRDWAKFLQMRKKEMKRGGLLMVTCPGWREDELFMKRYMEMLVNVWQAYRKDGTISEKEFLDTNLSVILYSPDDLKQTLEDNNSPDILSGLRLVSAELVVKDSIVYNIWKNTLDEEGVDDRAKFTRDYLAANWNWNYGTFLAGLSGERSEAERHEVLDKLYQDLEREIKAISPKEFKGDLVYSFVLIKKE